MQIRNTKATKKKAAPKKKVTPKKKRTPSRLNDFPEDIQKKARKFASDLMKNEPWKLRRTNVLESLPRGKNTVRVKKQSMDDLGGYASDGGHILAFIKRLHKFIEVAQKKGATDFRVSCRRVILTANRKETDDEFQQRYDDITRKRAYTLAIREAKAELDKKKGAEERERLKLEELKDFRNTIKRLGCDEAQKIIDSVRRLQEK